MRMVHVESRKYNKNQPYCACLASDHAYLSYVSGTVHKALNIDSKGRSRVSTRTTEPSPEYVYKHQPPCAASSGSPGVLRMTMKNEELPQPGRERP